MAFPSNPLNGKVGIAQGLIFKACWTYHGLSQDRFPDYPVATDKLKMKSLLKPCCCHHHSPLLEVQTSCLKQSKLLQIWPKLQGSLDSAHNVNWVPGVIDFSTFVDSEFQCHVCLKPISNVPQTSYSLCMTFSCMDYQSVAFLMQLWHFLDRLIAQVPCSCIPFIFPAHTFSCNPWSQPPTCPFLDGTGQCVWLGMPSLQPPATLVCTSHKPFPAGTGQNEQPGRWMAECSQANRLGNGS